MCQDTGQVVVFLEVGGEVAFTGDIEAAINAGVRQAYMEGYLRKSVVNCPLIRNNTGDNTPAIIHTRITTGDKLKITVVPKGGGAENMSAVKMFTPAAGEEGIVCFVIDTVRAAGGKACPPLIIGVGIGGNLEKAPLLAKEALIRDLDDESPLPHVRALEERPRRGQRDGNRTDGIRRNRNRPGGEGQYLSLSYRQFAGRRESQCHVARHKSMIL